MLKNKLNLCSNTKILSRLTFNIVENWYLCNSLQNKKNRNNVR